MKRYLLPGTGRFYKANLHTHSTLSDGKITPEEYKKLYMEKGYSVLAITEHELFMPHPELADENFVPISGVEMSMSEPDGKPHSNKLYHINLLAKRPDIKVTSCFCAGYTHYVPQVMQYVSPEQKEKDFPRYYSVERANEMAALANSEDFLVSFNHPGYSLQDYSDYAGLEGFWGTEVYNHVGSLQGIGEDDKHFEYMLNLGKRVFPLATDDAHELSGVGGGWVCLKAEKLTYESVITALEKGDFYASSGPEIKELYLDDGILHLSCSEVMRITVKTERRDGWILKGEPGKLLTGADIDLRSYIRNCHELKGLKRDPYFRIIISDIYGENAYTRGYFVDEFETL